jgi:hypothetical protein
VPQQSLDLDLDEQSDYRVRVISHHRGTHTVFEGVTQFRITDMPRYRGDRGPRKMLATLAAPGLEWIAPDDYQSGGAVIDNGLYVCYLLDRWETISDEQARASLEMALDVFCVQNNLTGVTFS